MTLRAIQRYAEFEGRSTRTEYWLFVLAFYIGDIALSLVGQMLAGENGADALSAIFVLATLLPSITVTVRRLHDTGRSGFNMLWALLPIIGWLILFVYTVMPSDPGVNEYGAPDDGASVRHYGASQFDELERLGRLRDQGVLDEDEFRARKARILGL